MSGQTDLSKYDNSWYKPGGNPLSRLMWYFVNALFFINPLNPFSGLKVFWLKLFGAKIGKGVIIKPGVNIKYPWHLSIGNHCWIGEKVWIDNLTPVETPELDPAVTAITGIWAISGSALISRVTSRPDFPGS